MKRLKQQSNPQRHSHLAAEAIAGLASREDFKSVALKSASLPMNQMWLPYKPIMLLQVKGRVHVQTRLVTPDYTSLNRGDCFILVANNQLYRYVGAFANIIEISRSKQICTCIIEHKDLGCTATSEITLLDDKVSNESQFAKFWEIMSKPDNYVVPECGHAEEDDLFEASLIETNKIYEFQDDSLVPLEQYWGTLPRYEMLESHKVLIFDFGSEVYVWNGKSASANAKRAAIKLAQEYFDGEYADYSQCYVNPLNYATVVGVRDSYKFKKHTEKRGDWCILGKISQNMETILFKEKFADWPEISRDYSDKSLAAGNMKRITAPDGAVILKGQPYEEPNLVLEHSNLGRGHTYYDRDTMRQFEIITKSIDKWKINEFNFDGVKSNAFGHFYSCDSYIVRWIYQISVTVRELSGKVSNRSTVGRERCVYFCWHGNDSTPNEKGTAALMTVELDKEKGSQLRVGQGEETTAFIRLFNLMFQHMGRTDQGLKRRSSWRLYQITGNLPDETVLTETESHARQLRSRTSAILLHGDDGVLYLWHGCKSPDHMREVAKNAVEKIQKDHPNELFTATTVKVFTMEEGEESDEFKSALGGFNRDAYCSLLNITDKTFDYTLRLFHFSSIYGSFEARELHYNLRCEHLHSPYPFTQNHLYSASQPAIFMLDDGDMLWVWIGWWPTEDPELADENGSPTNDNRSGVMRWNAERRATLETAVDYWRAKFGEKPDEKHHGVKGFVVWAGLEPVEFKALFPEWNAREDVRELNISDGRTEDVIPISTILSELTQTEYPLSVLLERPLPEGVDPTCLEDYLSAEDFKKCLDMTREEYDQLPLWKQTNLKKERGLF